MTDSKKNSGISGNSMKLDNKQGSTIFYSVGNSFGASRKSLFLKKINLHNSALKCPIKKVNKFNLPSPLSWLLSCSTKVLPLTFLKRFSGFGGGLGFFLTDISGELPCDFTGLFSASEMSLFEKPCFRKETGVRGGLGGKGGAEASADEEDTLEVL